MAKANIKGDKISLVGQSSNPAGSEGLFIYNSTDKDLKIYDGSNWNSIGGAVFNAVKKTGDYTIQTSECDGNYLFSNTIALKLTLPTASAGLKVTISNSDDVVLQIASGSGDKIINGTAELDSLFLFKKGDIVVLHAVDATNWYVLKFPVVVERIYGFFGGGQDSGGYTNVIDYILLSSVTQNAVDRGDLTVARRFMAGIYGSVYGFYFGGEYGADVVIDYINVTIASGNAVSRGNTFRAGRGYSGVSGSTYGLAGGNTASSTDIEYLDTTILVGNALDAGNLSVARFWTGSVWGTTYGYFAGGNPGSSNVIDYVSFSTPTANALDTGDLTINRCQLSGVTTNSYGFYCGGQDEAGGVWYNTIDYISTITTIGNAIDRGDLTVARSATGATHGSVNGFIGGGHTAGLQNVIDYIDMTIVSGNATDTGDLTVSRFALAGV